MVGHSRLFVTRELDPGACAFSVDSVQLRTTKVKKLSISGTRFFGRNLMTVLKLDRQKELKNGVFMLFP